MCHFCFIMKERKRAEQVEKSPVQELLGKPLRWILALKLSNSHMHWRLDKTQMAPSWAVDFKRLQEAADICLARTL